MRAAAKTIVTMWMIILPVSIRCRFALRARSVFVFFYFVVVQTTVATLVSREDAPELHRFSVKVVHRRRLVAYFFDPITAARGPLQCE